MIVALLAVPFCGALLLLLVPPHRLGLRPGAAGAGAAGAERYVRAVGLLASGGALLLAVLVAATFDYGQPRRMARVVDLSWAPAIGLRFHVGVDGISLPLVVLTALLTFLCLVYGQDRHQSRALTGLVLLLEVGTLGTFVALDLMLFFLFLEAVLIPMYFMIAIWGGPGRRAAASTYVLYMMLGSGVLLVGLLLIAVHGGTLDMVVLARRHGAGLSHGVQVAAFGLAGLGFAVKAPIWPLHSWLPDALTEAPTAGSVLLAGVLLKTGTYGLVRIALPMAPAGARTWAPWLGLLAVAGICYASLACLAQRQLTRMVAYSTVGGMGFVLLGIATLTPAGTNGALFGNVAHGLIIGLLFFAAGSVRNRYGTGDLDALGGGTTAMPPRLAAMLGFAAVAGLGLPGLAGFWGELLALLGAYRPAAGLPRPAFVTFMAAGGLGAVLTTAYFLRLLAGITRGVVPVAREEVRAHEYAVWAPLVILIVAIGLWPKILLDLTDGPVRALLGGG
ncbi:MAG TPA: NADH-quinone oxidoreductase subunit M [Streptosporangiaceae bacterium]